MNADAASVRSARRVKSADRALAVLELVARHEGGVKLSEVADLLSLPRSSTHGLLRTMTDAGWLRVNEGQFRIGIRAWLIGRSAAALDGLLDGAHEVLARAAAVTGETAQFVVLDGGMCLYLAIEESPNPMRLLSREGSRLHPHATAVGRAMLAALPDDEVTSMLAAVELQRFTENTVTDLGGLRGRIALARTDGYATEVDEYIVGSCCVAAAVGVEHDIGLTCGVSITTPTYRQPDSWPAAHLPALATAVNDIRTLLLGKRV